MLNCCNITHKLYMFRKPYLNCPEFEIIDVDEWKIWNVCQSIKFSRNNKKKQLLLYGFKSTGSVPNFIFKWIRYFEKIIHQIINRGSGIKYLDEL